MEERLDKLFREKLAGHKIAPTESAWEQINDQLSHKKRKAWLKRMAMAASFLLLISVGLISYRYINQIAPTPTELSESKTTEESKGNPQSAKSGESTIQDTAREDNTLSKEEIDSETNTQEQHASKTIKSVESKPVLLAWETKTESAPEAAESEYEPGIKETAGDLPITVLADNSIQEPEEAELINEDKKENEPDANPEVSASEKTYPTVKIIYKADKNSELLASNNKNFIDKGIKKITKFSDEHIITDQVKTKLRNTKDDLLALNFGKLLNKSNKEDIDN